MGNDEIEVKKKIIKGDCKMRDIQINVNDYVNRIELKFKPRKFNYYAEIDAIAFDGSIAVKAKPSEIKIIFGYVDIGSAQDLNKNGIKEPSDAC